MPEDTTAQQVSELLKKLRALRDGCPPGGLRSSFNAANDHLDLVLHKIHNPPTAIATTVVQVGLPNKFVIIGLLISTFIFGGSAGYSLLPTPDHLTLPEYFKDMPCDQEYDINTGHPKGWMLLRGNLFLSSYEGSCADFYKLFRIQP